MKDYVIIGMSYEKVLELQKELRSEDIDCNVVVSGFRIYPRSYQVEAMKTICKKLEGVPTTGLTFTEENVIYLYKPKEDK